MRRPGLLLRLLFIASMVAVMMPTMVTVMMPVAEVEADRRRIGIGSAIVIGSNRAYDSSDRSLHAVYGADTRGGGRCVRASWIGALLGGWQTSSGNACAREVSLILREP